MIGVKEELANIEKQFISLNELLYILSKLENITVHNAAQWLSNNTQILNRSKKLVMEDSYRLIEYEYSDSNYYNCPIKTIEDIANDKAYHEDSCIYFIDCIGFSRMNILMDLKQAGADIDDELIKDSRPYISQSSFENDDNFYKNQCRHMEKLYSKTPKEPQFNKQAVNYYQYIDSSHSLYIPTFALLVRVHHDLNTLDRYSDETTKIKRVKLCLEEYGANYNYPPTDTNATHISNLIKTRTAAKQAAKQVMAKIISQD